MDKRVNELKNEYNNIPTPRELDLVIRQSIKEGKKAMKYKSFFRRSKIAVASVAASFALLIAGVNTSHALASSLSDLPAIGVFIKVLTFREYKVDNGPYFSDVQIPEISGLKDKELEKSLNDKYLKEGQELYTTFMEEMKYMQEQGGGHLGLSSGYEILTDNDKILSIMRFFVNTVGSSSTILKYDTIDKEKGILITLESLFKDDSYLNLLMDNVTTQMSTGMKTDSDHLYWLNEVESAFDNKDFSFYINEDGKLVITFNKYAVAPGAMGNPEFVIPTEVIDDVLINGEYIR